LLCLPACGDDGKNDKVAAKAGNGPAAQQGQPGKRGKGRRGKGRRGKGRRGKGKGAFSRDLMTVCDRVQCTDAQVEQINPLLADFRKQAQEDLKELNVAQAELASVYRNPPFDADAMTAAFAKLDEQQAKMHANASATLVSLHEILDGGQRLLLAQGLEEVGPMRTLDPMFHRRRVPPGPPPQPTDENGEVKAYDSDPQASGEEPDDEPADAPDEPADADGPDAAPNDAEDDEAPPS
jgi:uncharacterized membrane protein